MTAALGRLWKRVRAALGRLWAIARMTLTEASRRKVFFILILFAAALLSSVAFFPSVDMAGRLRLMEVWALRATSLFTAIIALFLSGFSLPSDFEQKRIYMLVSKPVSKATIYLGKLLGLSLLLAIFVGTMGLVTVVFIRGVQLFAGPSFPALVARQRSPAAEFGHVRGKALEGEQGKLVITAQAQGALAWRFTGLSRSDFGDRIHLESRLSVGAPDDMYRASGNVVLEARGPSGKRRRVEQFLNTNEEKEWILPREVMDGDGTLEVFVRCGDSDGFIIGTGPGLAVYLKSTLFELAFARGLVLLLLQSMTVLSLTLMASAFLSAPLSILLGIMLFMVGTAHSYVKDGARDIDRSLSEVSAGRQRHRMPEEIPPWFLRFSSVVSKGVLAAVPDFDQFDFSRWLLKDRAVSGRELLAAAGHAALPVLVLGALGMLVMVFKDFDR